MAHLFTKQEIRGIALLLPMVVVAVWILVGALSNKDSESATPASQTVPTPPADTLRLSAFDPNTISYEELRAMGVEKYVARGIVKYREGGRTFAIPEDVAIIYGISDSLYALLKPHIRIAEEYRIKPKTYPTKSQKTERKFRQIHFDPNTLTAEGFYELGCFSARQAEAMVEYRERRGGFRSELEWRDCYLIDSALWEQTKPYLQLSPIPQKLIDLNSADSLTLVGVAGVGPRTASDIILYRNRLGGYYSVAQLLDLRVVSNENYNLMKEEFWCDSCKIRKIDINFAAPKELAEHPYITTPRLRKILKQQKTKGGWKGLEEFLNDDIFEKQVREKLAPYFRFTSIE